MPPWSLNSTSVPELVRRAGRQQFEPAQLRRPDFLGLHHFQIGQLQQQTADLGIIGRIIAALAHAPEIVSFGQVQFVRAGLDGDLRDVVDGKSGSSFWPMAVPALCQDLLVALMNDQPAAPTTATSTNRMTNCFRFICAEVFFRLMTRDADARQRHGQRHGQNVEPFQPRFQRHHFLAQILLRLLQFLADLRLLLAEIVELGLLLRRQDEALVLVLLLLLQFAQLLLGFVQALLQLLDFRLAAGLRRRLHLLDGVNGRLNVARLRTPMRLLSPAICSTRFCAKSRLAFIGLTIVPNGLSILRSENWSDSMSESPTRTTELSALDSFNESPALRPSLLVPPRSCPPARRRESGLEFSGQADGELVIHAGRLEFFIMLRRPCWP